MHENSLYLTVVLTFADKPIFNLISFLMRTKNLFGLGLLSLLAWSCVLNEPANPGDQMPVLEASFEAPATRTSVLTEGTAKYVVWDKGDQIAVFMHNSKALCYTLADGAGQASGNFKYTSGFATAFDFPLIYAAYPYDKDLTISPQGEIDLVIPAEQTYAEGGFGPGCNPMLAVSQDNKMFFQNVCGYLVLQFYGEDVKVKSVTITTGMAEQVAGPVSVEVGLDQEPRIYDWGDGATEQVTLTCPEPVQIGATADEATEFWLALAPGSLMEGFSVQVEWDETFCESTDLYIEIPRGGVYRMAPLEIAHQPVRVSSISLDKEELEIEAEEMYQFTVTVEPEDAENKEVTWTSSDPDVAEVDEDGILYAYTPGEVTITATSVDNPDATATCAVTVTVPPIPIQDIYVDGPPEAYIGDTWTLGVEIYPADAAYNQITFESLNPDIVSVDADGNCEALAEGNASITVSAGGYTVTWDVTVMAVTAEEITIDPEEFTLYVGSTQQLTADITPGNATYQTLTWSSEDEDIATVDQNGLVTAVAPGEAIITAKNEEGVEGYSLVTVEALDDNILFWEGFEGYPHQGTQVDGWTFLNADGDEWCWFTLSDQAADAVFNHSSGDGHLTSASYLGGVLFPDNWAITPAIPLAASDNYLSFWVAPQDPSWAEEHYAVYVTTVSPEEAEEQDYTCLFEETLGDTTPDTTIESTSATVSRFILQIPAAFNGETVYIAFRHYDCSDMFRINLDDVMVTVGAPTIPYPTPSPSPSPAPRLSRATAGGHAAPLNPAVSATRKIVK